jgi:hypothetical protein
MAASSFAYLGGPLQPGLPLPKFALSCSVPSALSCSTAAFPLYSGSRFIRGPFSFHFRTFEL